MIPHTYDQWRHCITVECGLALTPVSIAERLAVWRNAQSEETLALSPALWRPALEGGDRLVRGGGPDGKLTPLLGRNGVGETTLLRCLMGVVNAKSDSRSHDVARRSRNCQPTRASRRGLPKYRRGVTSFRASPTKRICWWARRAARRPRRCPTASTSFPMLH